MSIYEDIRNWSLQSFSQDYDLASHTAYVVRVNLYTLVESSIALIWIITKR